MPCSDGGPSYSVPPDVQARLDKVTRLLCELCTQIQGNHLTVLFSDELTGWWNKHQEADRKRLEAEEAEQARQRRKQAALRKLSPDERILLGL